MFSAAARQAARKVPQTSICRAFCVVSAAGFLVPAFSLVNLFAHLWGLDSTMSSVKVDIEQSSGKENSVSFFELTLFTSLTAFKSANAWLVTVLVGGTTGMMPEIVSMGIFYCWFTPLTEAFRGRALRWIESLVKWTLVRHSLANFSAC